MSVFQRIFSQRGGDLKKKAFTVIIWVIIAVVALVTVGGLFDNEPNEKNDMSEAEYDDANFSFMYDYISREEENLSKKLSRVNGAGNVTVAVTVDNTGESVLAKNIDMSNEQSGEEGENSSSRNETVVLKGGSGNGEPIIVTENVPKISGVIVISSGAGDESVKNELYESVKALYGIPSHRIKILTGNQ